ncbi:zf-HC2 domain-containing protein [Streptomyces sp. NPDC052114]|uniref:zf-HC2 domain-containing protein n=1 Tax=unclassified Streptomyces TaxID=2593676 RepID=UPI00341A7CE4
MRPQERHRDAGAYALGVLDPADAFRFEDHLSGCPACLLALDELTPTARQLTCLGRGTQVVAPSPGLLDRLLGETGRLRAARRRRSLCAVAAAVLLAVGAPAVSVVTADGNGPSARVSAGEGGVRATLTAYDRAWGTEIGLTVRDPGASGWVCELVAVATDGSEQTVTTWRAPAGTVRTWGVAALRPARTDRYEVRTADGKRLLTLPRP